MKNFLTLILICTIVVSCNISISNRNYGVVIEISDRIDEGCRVTIRFSEGGSRSDIVIDADCNDFKVGDTLYFYNSRTHNLVKEFKFDTNE